MEKLPRIIAPDGAICEGCQRSCSGDEVAFLEEAPTPAHPMGRTLYTHVYVEDCWAAIADLLGVCDEAA